MKTKAGVAVLAAVLSIPALATAQPQDRITFGSDAVVRPDEVVNDVVTMGGDARIDGEVLGDVVTMGGDARVDGEVKGEVVTMGGDLSVGPAAVIHGDLSSMGGDISVAEGAVTHGDRVRNGGPHLSWGPGSHHPHGDGGVIGWITSALSGLVAYTLLFVLGLLLMGVTRERFEALQVVIVKQPLRSFGMGLLGLLGAAVTIVVLCITIIGIPAGVVLAIALPFAVYVGLVASASVLGAALPVEKLRGQPVLQLAAGCGALWLASLVPFAGDMAVGVAAVVGVGALVVTRGGPTSRLDPGPDPIPSGPYRTSAV